MITWTTEAEDDAQIGRELTVSRLVASATFGVFAEFGGVSYSRLLNAIAETGPNIALERHAAKKTALLFEHRLGRNS